MMTYFAKMAEINFVHDQMYIYSSIMNAIYIWHIYTFPIALKIKDEYTIKNFR